MADFFSLHSCLTPRLGNPLEFLEENLPRENWRDVATPYGMILTSTVLANRRPINGRAIGTLLRPSVVVVVVVCRLSSSVTLCIVAKRCVLEQKLLLRAYRKSYMRNRLVPK